MVIFPNCKINLGLRILDKRPDGFHNLQSIFFPLSIQDALEIISGTEDIAIRFSVSGMDVNTNIENNTVFKACALMQNEFPSIGPLEVHLHKHIPMGAGLGGGSADGAFALVMINEKFSLGLTEEQLINYAASLGSDCPFFIFNQPCLVTGRGEKLEKISLDLSAFSIAVIHPGIHISTAWAFSQISPGEFQNSLLHIIQNPVETWKESLVNDFEKPVFSKFPEIQNIKNVLYEKGAMYASMSGSGSSVYGLFKKGTIPSFNFPSSYFIKTID